MIPSNRPTAEPDNSYSPMGKRPADLECGSPVHSGHTSPPCCLVGWLLHESRMEAPSQLHVYAVPSHVEPIPLYLSDPLGPSEEVTDSGELGGRPWSLPMERRMGIKFFEGEWAVDDHDYQQFPLARAMVGMRRFCSSKHSSWTEHRGEPVCYLLLELVVKGRFSVSEAADRLDLTPERAIYLLHRFNDRSWVGAADKLWTWVANDINGISLRRRMDAA